MSVFGFLRRPYVEMSDTNELLWAYVSEGSEQAFNEIVRRHVDFVHSTALRKVAEDTHLAQDVTQIVFADLARKAKSLPKGVVLIGWLHRDACFRAADAVRSEHRRRVREEKALEMETVSETAEDRWVHLAPFLDDALEKLSALERDALLLRFVEGKTWRQTGEALALSEDAVQKRAGRALEKLRAQFARRGIVISTAVMATALAANSVQAAPIGLAASLAGTALAGAGTPSVTTSLAETLLMTTKTKIAIVAAAGIAAVTAPIVWQHQANTRRDDELATWRQENARLSAAAEQKSATTPAGNFAGSAMLNWRALESPDYRQYIANLRAAGCPEQTIRDIIITDLERVYGQRIAKLSTPSAGRSYWIRQYSTVNTRRELEIKQIEEEKRAAIRELLGIDAEEEAHRRTGVPVPYDEGFEFLPGDKRACLREIDREFKALVASNDAQRAAWRESDHHSQRRDIYVWKEEAIKGLLSPEEFEEYEIRSGYHAQGLRVRLSPFEPSEQEFRKILQIEKDFGKDKDYIDPRDVGLPSGSALDPVTKEQFEKALREELGERRYAEYKLSMDNNYGFLHSLVQGSELPRENARAVFDLNKSAEQRARAIRDNSALTAEAREAAFQALQKQTEEEASRLLGEEGFRAYQWQFARLFDREPSQ
jgi:RNA polymerase sigma factor (sigma-70 family)